MRRPVRDGLEMLALAGLPASGRFRIRQPTFAGTSRNDADALEADPASALICFRVPQAEFTRTGGVCLSQLVRVTIRAGIDATFA